MLEINFKFTEDAESDGVVADIKFEARDGSLNELLGAHRMFNKVPQVRTRLDDIMIKNFSESLAKYSDKEDEEVGIDELKGDPTCLN